MVITIDKNGIFIVKSDDGIKSYDNTGKLVDTDKKYNNVLLLSKEYIVYSDGNDIFISTEGKKI